jgi:DNA-binding transcriptional regulator YiaG
MTNHANRNGARGNPAPAEVKAAREAAELTQRAAAELLYTSTRVWQQWEAGDRRMHPTFWEHFIIKIDPRFAKLFKAR